MPEKRYRLPQVAFFQGFEAAARNLSFTKAAAELFITQSAVSRQIKALEDHLGVALFERRARSLVLTEPGQALTGSQPTCWSSCRPPLTGSRPTAAPDSSR
jgi:LysR family glycine cleavage system transcriptional activator